MISNEYLKDVYALSAWMDSPQFDDVVSFDDLSPKIKARFMRDAARRFDMIGETNQHVVELAKRIYNRDVQGNGSNHPEFEEIDDFEFVGYIRIAYYLLVVSPDEFDPDTNPDLIGVDIEGIVPHANPIEETENE